MIVCYMNLENTANDPLSVNPNLKAEEKIILQTCSLHFLCR